MLQRLHKLRGHTLAASDGDIGSVRDFLFEDENWHLRYLVADTGHWLPGRKVLIPIAGIGGADWSKRLLPVDRTREEVKNAPGLDEDRPVSRQFEMELHEHYRWLPYWGYQGVGQTQPFVAPAPELESATGAERHEDAGDPHLRSVEEVLGYRVSAGGEEVGTIHDFIADTVQWRCVLLLVDTGQWLAGRRVAVPLELVTRVRLAGETVEVACRKEALEAAPEMDSDSVVDDAALRRVQEYYAKLPG